MTRDISPEILNNLPIILFETPRDWETWLDANHTTSKGLWLRLAKGSGIASATYEEALDVALCYGWIDGQKNGYDDTSWLQKFTPRGAKEHLVEDQHGQSRKAHRERSDATGGAKGD